MRPPSLISTKIEYKHIKLKFNVPFVRTDGSNGHTNTLVTLYKPQPAVTSVSLDIPSVAEY